MKKILPILILLFIVGTETYAQTGKYCMTRMDGVYEDDDPETKTSDFIIFTEKGLEYRREVENIDTLMNTRDTDDYDKTISKFKVKDCAIKFERKSKLFGKIKYEGTIEGNRIELQEIYSDGVIVDRLFVFAPVETKTTEENK